MSEEVQKKKLNIPLLVALVVIVICAICAAVYFYNQDKTLKQRTEEALKEETIPAKADSIIGNYNIKMISGGQESECTGYIDQDDLGNCVLHILSEYEPQTLMLTLTADGTLVNDELGEGTLTYKASADLTTITFVNGDLKCILTK